MLGIEIRTETVSHAYHRVFEELKEAEVIALGPGATKRDIDRYNRLYGQIRRRHSDGTVGHLHLEREIVVFGGITTLPAPSKKVPLRLKYKST